MTRSRQLWLIGISTLFLLGLSFATQTTFIRLQQTEPLNERASSAADTSVGINLAALANRPVRLSAVMLRCSAGSANMTIATGPSSTIVYESGVGGIGTTLIHLTFPIPITDTTQIITTIGACGTGNTGFLSVVGDRG